MVELRFAHALSRPESEREGIALDLYVAITISATATGVSASVATAIAKIVVTKNKIRLLREALKDVPGAERPAVLQALAEVL
ncbi:hypothetical protein [Nocardia colli]|uniref:hypothetical protein n=1 Tax=Nocardia colli TaxID=2545717 RepID=UPI0035DC432B